MGKKNRGFTLVEIMIVVVIIGLLAAMGIPAFKRITLKSQGTTCANNLRQFAHAFEQYATEKGGWPENANAKEVPTGMDGRLPEVAWTTPTPGLHEYDWDTGVLEISAAISIRPLAGYNADPLFVEIDKVLDDGNISTGRFRLVSDRFMYILED